MSAFLERGEPVSREEFRRWVEEQPRGRYERVNGRIVAMAPERGAHLRAKAAAWLALRNAILAAALPCQALPDGATIECGDSDYEPDAIINCGEPMGDDAIAAPNPVVVVEVLSPTTRGTDTGAKLADYFRVASVEHYLIIHPTRRLVIHHRRRAEPPGIDTAILTSGIIRLDPPGITVELDRFYPGAI
jgi:Uma2 family endonuclease